MRSPLFLKFLRRSAALWFAAVVAVLLVVQPAAGQKPVRGSLFKKQLAGLPAEQQGAEPDNRFADTLTIAVGDRQATTGEPQEEYEKAVEFYQGKRYAEACALFVRLGKTLSKRHQLRPDVLFMNAECAAVDGRLNEAQGILEGLLGDAATPPQVLEKTIVRLGHVYCGLGDTVKAGTFFTRLKREFPNSAYLRVASCNALE